MIDWDVVETVFLDMDGTLLDLHFDDYFWREHVPRRYAEKRGLSLETAKDELFSRYLDMQGTLEWYSVDYWSSELGLDIAVLKQEVEHLIAVHPHVIGFLDAVRSLEKRAILVTNAHGKSLALKMNRTKIGGHLDALVCAHDLGIPKEDERFWSRLQDVEFYLPEKTALVEDSVSVLKSASSFGIHYLVAVLQPNSRKPLQRVEGFPAIRSFAEITPPLGNRAG
jgi:putative hydrolase of the HAD superfamily